MTDHPIPGIAGYFINDLNRKREEKRAAAQGRIKKPYVDTQPADTSAEQIPVEPVSAKEEPAPYTSAPTAAEFFEEEVRKAAPSPSAQVSAEPTKDKSSRQAANEDTIVELDTGLIDEWELNDRPVDEFGDISDLTLRINQHGQIVPILVRPKKGGRYELIYGRRRWTACKELGLKVKAFVRKLTDQGAYQAMVNENAGREDISSWARALSYKKALDMGVYPSQAALAAHLGLNKATLSNIMIYNRIPDEIASAVGSFAKVGIGTVKAILSLAEDKANIEHIVANAALIRSGKMADKALTRTVEAARTSSPCPSGTKSVLDASGNKLFSMRRTERGVWSVTLAKDLTRDLSEEEVEARLKAAFKCE